MLIPKPITDKGNQITMIYVNDQDLSLVAGEKATPNPEEYSYLIPQQNRNIYSKNDRAVVGG